MSTHEASERSVNIGQAIELKASIDQASAGNVSTDHASERNVSRDKGSERKFPYTKVMGATCLETKLVVSAACCATYTSPSSPMELNHSSLTGHMQAV